MVRQPSALDQAATPAEGVSGKAVGSTLQRDLTSLHGCPCLGNPVARIVAVTQGQECEGVVLRPRARSGAPSNAVGARTELPRRAAGGSLPGSAARSGRGVFAAERAEVGDLIRICGDRRGRVPVGDGSGPRVNKARHGRGGVARSRLDPSRYVITCRGDSTRGRLGRARGQRVQEGLNRLAVPADRPVLPPLPVAHRGLVHAEPRRHRLPREPEGPACEPEPLGKRRPRLEWNLPDEFEDPGHVAERRLVPVVLPSAHGIGRNPEFRCYLVLEEPRIEPAVPKVVAERDRLRNVLRGNGFGRCQTDTAKRQRNGARAGTSGSRSAAAVAATARSGATGAG